MGHEGIGIIEEIGGGVSQFKKGDKVLISCITSCGSCEYCKKQMYAHCKDGGWILGYMIDGVQAEYVRIPHADNSLHSIPENIKSIKELKKPIIAVCKSGGRSQSATDFLSQHGLDVINGGPWQNVAKYIN